MSNISYRQIPAALDNLQAFTGNSMTGYRQGNLYTVFSYHTIMLSLNVVTGEYWQNENHYSPTTSHHQNILKRFLAIEGSRRVLRGDDFVRVIRSIHDFAEMN